MEALVDIKNHRLAGRCETGLMIEEAYDEHISNPPDSQEDVGAGLFKLVQCIHSMLFTGGNPKDSVLNDCPPKAGAKLAAWYDDHSKEDIQLMP